jgi:RND family efflux transporter MFP subunit
VEAAPQKRGRTAIVVGVGLTLLLAILLAVRIKQALTKKQQIDADRIAAQQAAASKPPAVVSSPVQASVKPSIEVTGTLQPWRTADVGFDQSGRLASVLVTNGETVKANQALAFLDTSLANAQVSGAEAQSRAAAASLALAEDNLHRTEALAQSKSIAEAQVEQVRQQVALARAQLEGARAQEQLARTGAGQRSLTAPFAGVVTRAPTAAGIIVNPMTGGGALIRIEDHSRFRLSVTVREEDAELVRVGAKADVRIRDRKVSGVVTTVVPSLDQATRRAPVEIVVDNDPKEPLLAWSFVHATIEGGKEVPALQIPESARRPGSQDEVFVLRDGKAKLLHVAHSIGANGTWIVREGLLPTDLVIVSPDADLKDGDAIEKSVQR